jgi:hypothetical protein
VYGHFDALAALIYGIRNLDVTTNPIPATFQTDQDNQVIFPYIQETGSIKALKDKFNVKGYR